MFAKKSLAASSSSKTRKIAIMGPSVVGKSALSGKYMGQAFTSEYSPTIEQTFRTSIKINSQDYELVLIDTAGQDQRANFLAQYAFNVHGYVLVYDIVNRKSFQEVEILHDRLVDLTGKTDVPLILVGNKLDLCEHRQVSAVEAKRLADKWQVQFLETSAKDRSDVKKIFELLLGTIERLEGNTPNSSCVVC